jgi:hypothetical protein
LKFSAKLAGLFNPKNSQLLSRDTYQLRVVS